MTKFLKMLTVGQTLSKTEFICFVQNFNLNLNFGQDLTKTTLTMAGAFEQI